MLTLKQLKDRHDKAYLNGQNVRERAADDTLFYRVTHWDDNLISDSSLGYRGQFDIIRKAGRQIMADLRSNPVQVDFKPEEDGRDELSDIMDGMYRSGTRENTSIEAFDNASGEAVVCGVGAWELYTEYKTNNAGNRDQVVKRRLIAEANSFVFWDPNAKLMDKSDAMYCSRLCAYTEEGYKEFASELTGRDPEEFSISSFAQPETTWTFVWVSDRKDIYVTNFYQREKIKEKVVVLVDPFGIETIVRGDDLDDQMETLMDIGYQVVSERTVERFEVRKYIASGSEILKSYIIPGGEIPIIPTYGERGWVEGVEWYEGCVRLAKDPQRLRNFQLSYLADMTARSNRNKPIFLAEQVKKYEFMYEDAGSENNYPYYLQNRFDANGNDLPLGPVGEMPDQKLSPSLVASIELSRQAVEDVANPGLPQDIADPDLSGKAVIALQNRLDQQSIVYQQNLKHAKRRDGFVYAAMISDICDTPRRVLLTRKDDTQEYEDLMVPCIDPESGQPVTKNDIRGVQYEVWADIGPDYSSLKEQTAEQLTALIQAVGDDPALRNILVMKLLQIMRGVEFDDVRDYAKRQLVSMGVQPPETQEEMQMLMAQQQAGAQPDPAMILAQAEILKGQAAQMREQRQAAKDQADAVNNRRKTDIDAFEAETDRMNTQIDAEQAGADINQTNIESFGKQLDNAGKLVAAQQNQYRASVSANIQ